MSDPLEHEENKSFPGVHTKLNAVVKALFAMFMEEDVWIQSSTLEYYTIEKLSGNSYSKLSIFLFFSVLQGFCHSIWPPILSQEGLR